MRQPETSQNQSERAGVLEVPGRNPVTVKRQRCCRKWHRTSRELFDAFLRA
jgi:hypothetical protein